MIPTDGDRWTELMAEARRQRMADDGDRVAAVLFGEAAALALAAGDRHGHLRAELARATAVSNIEGPGPLRVALGLRDLLEPDDPGGLAAQVHAMAANAAATAGDEPTALDEVAEARALLDAQQGPGHEVMAALTQLVAVYTRLECYDEAAALLRRPLDDWPAFDDGRAAAFACFWVASIEFEAGEYVGPLDPAARTARLLVARAHAERAEELGGSTGSALARNAGVLWAALCDASLGEPRRALARLARARITNPCDEALDALARARAHAALGDGEAVTDWLERAEAAARRGGELMLATIARQDRALRVSAGPDPNPAADAWRDLYLDERRRRVADAARRAEALRTRTELRATRLAAREREAVIARLRDLSERDELTGLLNRRGFAQAVHATAGLDPDGSLGVVMIDVDHFKEVNDRHSHAVGDEVLVRIAGSMTSAARSGDVLARLGGDEFAIVVTPAAGAAAVARRVLAAVAGAAWGELAPGLRVTVSIGVAVVSADEPGGLLAAADAALYRAKAGGRNRIVIP